MRDIRGRTLQPFDRVTDRGRLASIDPEYL